MGKDAHLNTATVLAYGEAQESEPRVFPELLGQRRRNVS